MNKASSSYLFIYFTFLAENPPDFLETFPDQLLKPGSSVSLKCSATGNPLPQISWFRYGRLLADRLGLRIGDFVDASGVVTSFVNVSSLATEHGGLYSCRAENELAVIEHTARLSVYGPPFVHRMDNVTYVTGYDAKIQCASSGYPITTVTWKKGIHPPYASSTLVLADVSVELEFIACFAPASWWEGKLRPTLRATRCFTY